MSAKRERNKRERSRRTAVTRHRPQPPSPSGLHKVLHDAGREAERLATVFLDRRDPAAGIAELADETRGLALRVIQTSPLAGQHACQPACAYCCHAAVTIAPPETFAIARYLQEHYSADTLQEMRRRMDRNAELASSITREEYIARLVPCALLTDDGHCLVHPVRPLACAGFLSTSRQKCEAEFNREPNRDAIPTDEFAAAAALCVAIGLRDGCKKARLDGTSFELHHALRRVLDTPDAAERWARGADVFAGCLTWA